MAGKQRSGSRSSSRNSAPKYPRGARVGATLREIIADELVRIDDERLSLVSITGIDVDPELNRAIVFFDSLDGEDGDEAILEALGEHRIRLQSSIAKQIRAKKTPILDFRPDLVIRSAERIDAILRSDRDRLERRGGRRAGFRHPTARTSPARRDRARSHLMARRRPATTHGLAIVDKPAGVTSHDVVGMLRRRFGERQVGHGGTLDPDATGVLVVAVGMTTRLLRFVETNAEGVRRRSRARHGDEHARRRGRGDGDVRHDRGDRRRRPTAGGGPPDRADPADPADGVGDPGRRQAPPRTGP